MNYQALSDGALAKGLLVKKGSDENHVVACGANEVPEGLTMTAATGANQPVVIATLDGLLEMTSSNAIAAGSIVETAANGRVVLLSGAAGTHYCVGVLLYATTGAGQTAKVVANLFIKDL